MTKRECSYKNEPRLFSTNPWVYFEGRTLNEECTVLQLAADPVEGPDGNILWRYQGLLETSRGPIQFRAKARINYTNSKDRRDSLGGLEISLLRTASCMGMPIVATGTVNKEFSWVGKTVSEAKFDYWLELTDIRFKG